MDYKVELVARALHEAERNAACLWDNESSLCKARFRRFARNAVDLLKDDIGVLLLALEQSTAERRDGQTRAAA